MTAYEQARADLRARNTCGRCGRRADGYAFIGEVRYCHGDTNPGPTCYQQEQAERAQVTA